MNFHHPVEVPPKTGRKKKGEGGNRRQEIIVAARQLMLRLGYDDTSMRTIAEAVGVSVAAIYLYFPDKEALFNEICREAFQPLIAATQNLLQGEEPPLARFRRGIKAYIEWGLSHPDEYALVFLSRRVSIQPHDHRQPFIFKGPDGSDRYNTFALLVAAINQLMELGLIQKQDPYLIAEVVWVSTHGLVSALVMRPNAPFSPRDQLIDAMLDMVLNGLVVSPANQL